MTRVTVKKRIDPLRMARTVAILTLSIGLTYGLFTNSIFNLDRTYALEYGKLNIEATHKSVILRKEFVVGTLSSGPVKYHVSEGALVKNGQRILTVTHETGIPRPKTAMNLSGGTATAYSTTASGAAPAATGSLNQATGGTQQSGVNQPVSGNKPAASNSVYIDPQALKRDIENIESKIAKAVMDGQLSVVATLKKELGFKLDKLEKIKKSKERNEFGDTSYHEIFFGGENRVPGQGVDFTSPIPGLITFNTDGLENALTVEKIYDLDYEKLIATGMVPRNLSGDRLNGGNPAFKVVDNSVWYIVSIVEKPEMDMFEKNKDVTVEIGSDSLKGVVVDIFEGSQDKGAVLIKLNEYYKDFYKLRFVDAKIIRKNFQGIKLYHDSIVQRDGVEGVFVKDINGNAQFVPVRVLGKNDEFAIAKPGFISIEKDGKMFRVKSLDLEQQVLRNGAKYLGQ